MERARRNTQADPSNVDFVVADAMDLSKFEAQSFDAVYSLTAIKHFPDPVKGLRDALRVLKPGGVLTIAEISRESTLAEVKALTRHLGGPGWLNGLLTRVVHAGLRRDCPTRDDVEAWLREAGLGPPERLSGYPARIAIFSVPTPS